MTESVASLSESELQAIKADVTKLVLSYGEAMNALDEQDILSHVIKSPNFAYTRRGTRSNIEQFKIGTRNLTKSFTNKVGSYSPIVVDVIAPEIAVATFTFEQTLTTTAGELRDFEGTVTWIAIKENGEWKYIHGLSY